MDSIEQLFGRLLRANQINISDDIRTQYQELIHSDQTETYILPANLNTFARPPMKAVSVFRDNEKIVLMPHISDPSMPRFIPHRHDFYEVSYVLSGVAKIIIENIEYESHAGTFIILNPQSIHAIDNSDTDVRILNILIREDFFQNDTIHMLKNNELLGKFFGRSLDYITAPEFLYWENVNSGEVESLIRMMMTETIMQMENNETVITYLFLAMLAQVSRMPLVHGNSDYDKLISLVIHMMYNRLDDIRLQDIAAELHYNSGYLSRKIKTETGKTFSQFLDDVRMNTASEYLLYSRMSIKEIAEKVGYYDISHFYKNFKKHFGYTPVKYRETLFSLR